MEQPQIVRVVVPRCDFRESGGVRCELHRGHVERHAFPAALERYLFSRGWLVGPLRPLPEHLDRCSWCGVRRDQALGAHAHCPEVPLWGTSDEHCFTSPSEVEIDVDVAAFAACYTSSCGGPLP